MSADLIMCALKRLGRPSTAATICDQAVGLALDAEYPGRARAITPKSAAALLKSLESRGLVRRQGSERVNSNIRPLWIPVSGFDAGAPVPPYSGTERDPSPLEMMNRPQQLAVFAVQDLMIQEMHQQRREQHALIEQHNQRWMLLIERTRAQLAAHGLEPA